MTIEYLGHSSFLITTNGGTRVVTDPFDPKGYPGSFRYNVFDRRADVVTASHEHSDHGSSYVVKGNPVVIKGNGKFGAGDCEFIGIKTYHDDVHGERRGENTVYIIRADGIRICHLGDLGHPLTSEHASQIGSIDVLMIPVGGYYTINHSQADDVIALLEPKIVLPMHYKTDKCNFPFASLDDFLLGKTNVIKQGSCVLEVTKQTLPQDQNIIILDYSL